VHDGSECFRNRKGEKERVARLSKRDARKEEGGGCSGGYEERGWEDEEGQLARQPWTTLSLVESGLALVHEHGHQTYQAKDTSRPFLSLCGKSVRERENGWRGG
jgi:hypothetical protein